MKKRTRLQKMVFGLLMSFTMVIGMEFYNMCIRVGGNITYSMIGELLMESSWLTIVVYLIQSYFGLPVANKIHPALFSKINEKSYSDTLAKGISTVLVMCPTMSLVACLIFKKPWDNFFPVYIMTVAINFPMALLWQNLIAGPLVRKVDNYMFER